MRRNFILLHPESHWANFSCIATMVAETTVNTQYVKSGIYKLPNDQSL